jgi:hypothetical protein
MKRRRHFLNRWLRFLWVARWTFKCMMRVEANHPRPLCDAPEVFVRLIRMVRIDESYHFHATALIYAAKAELRTRAYEKELAAPIAYPSTPDE